MKVSKNYKYIIYASFEASIIAVICFMIGKTLSTLVSDGKSYIDGLWCMISALVVLQSIIDDSLKTAKSRVIGTMFGSIIAGLVCIIFGYGYTAILLAIGLCVLILNLLNFEDGVRIATATAAVITGYGFMNPDYSPIINAVMRSIDTLIGVLFSILIVYISYKLKIRRSRH